MNVLEPAIDPNSRLTFLLDWELTMKCNLDCSYCPTGIYGGHDNTTRHPPLDECVKTIDFMFAYVDLYMQQRVRGLRRVVLNIYGGEGLNHPNIVEILQQVRQKHEAYQQSWSLTVAVTTNAIVSKRILDSVMDLVDEFTVSYHTENTAKHKQQFLDNLLAIRDRGRRVKCVVLMHPEPDLFADAQAMIDWCQEHNIRHLARQLDHQSTNDDFNYSGEQVVWFDRLYKKRSYQTEPEVEYNATGDLAASGRACCGGRQLCADQDYQKRTSYVTNQFPGWFCSVNEFFVYIKQVNGEIFVNKDCKMTFDQTVAPIGHLDRADELIEFTKNKVLTGEVAPIQCAKPRCHCGLCAPKASDLATYQNIMKKYRQ